MKKLDQKVLEKIKEIVWAEYYENYKLNLYRLARALDIDLYEAVFDDASISGYISKNENGKFEIVINKFHSPERKRFTLAHELGHYISFLAGSHSARFFQKNDTISDKLFRSEEIPEENKAMEIEANDIAGELLMPKTSVETMVLKNYTKEDMAFMFEVSTDAMSVRLSRLYPYNYLFLF